MDKTLTIVTRATTAAATVALCTSYGKEYVPAMLYSAVVAHLARGDLLAGPSVYWALTSGYWEASPLSSIALYAFLFTSSDSNWELGCVGKKCIELIIEFVKSRKTLRIDANGVSISAGGKQNTTPDTPISETTQATDTPSVIFGPQDTLTVPLVPTAHDNVQSRRHLKDDVDKLD